MTFNQVAAMALAVAGGVAYHLAQKGVPRDAGPLVVLFHAYLIAAGLALILLIAGGQWRALAARPLPISVALGAAVLAIEVGVLLVYRSGWPVGRAALVNSVLVTAVLLPVGFVAFHEELTPGKLAGLAVCLVGLAMVCR